MYEVRHCEKSYGKFPLFVQAVKVLWKVAQSGGPHCHIERNNKPWSSYLDTCDAAREYGWVVDGVWIIDSETGHTMQDLPLVNQMNHDEEYLALVEYTTGVQEWLVVKWGEASCGPPGSGWISGLYMLREPKFLEYYPLASVLENIHAIRSN